MDDPQDMDDSFDSEDMTIKADDSEVMNDHKDVVNLNKWLTDFCRV